VVDVAVDDWISCVPVRPHPLPPLLRSVVDAEEGDVPARDHEIARPARWEPERALDHVEAFRALDRGAPRMLATMSRKLLLAVRELVLTGRPQPDQVEREPGEPVQRPDRRIEEDVEGTHRQRHGDAGCLGALDGDALRGKLTEDDVQERDRQERSVAPMVSTVASLSPNRRTSGSRMRAKAGSPDPAQSQRTRP